MQTHDASLSSTLTRGLPRISERFRSQTWAQEEGECYWIGAPQLVSSYWEWLPLTVWKHRSKTNWINSICRVALGKQWRTDLWLWANGNPAMSSSGVIQRSLVCGTVLDPLRWRSSQGLKPIAALCFIWDGSSWCLLHNICPSERPCVCPTDAEAVLSAMNWLLD